MLTRAEKERKLVLLVEQKVRAGRKNFYDFCRAVNPGFYKPDRTYLKELCDAFQGLYEGTLINEKTGKSYKKMALSLPPGHGKSYTAGLFSMWAFGQDINNQIITTSYNEKMASRFGATVRDGIEAVKGGYSDIVFKDFYPFVNVKRGDASKISWTLEGRYFSYLASSFEASLTGMRGNIGIIDDPVKNAKEAFNERVLEEQWNWYTDTFLSRMLEGAIQIIIATRWATKDLIGRAIEKEPDEWYELRMPALVNKDSEEMLCEELLSYQTYKQKQKLTTPEIFSANYDQEPVDVKGKLYNNIKTYEKIPVDAAGFPLFEQIINYTDTADQGEDYLASIVAGVYEGQAYVLDVLYTKDGMEVTEPKQAEMLVKNKANIAHIESNNGGRGYARSVERILHEEHKNRSISIEWFHQSQNKKARILSNATGVMNNVYFPVNWKDRWPEFFKAIDTYQKEGKNTHDDAADALTGLYEKIAEGTGIFIGTVQL